MSRAAIFAGLALLAVGILPLGAYALFGPADGNPIGLGLLFIVATPLGVVALLVGVASRIAGR